MQFLTDSDLRPLIKDANLSRMIEGDETILDTAETTAIQVVRDAIHSRYDHHAVFSAVGPARNAQVVRWIAVLTLYYLYERLPANIMPERVRLNYDETIKFILDVEDAKKSIMLPPRMSDGLPSTKFRGGSALPKRSHKL